MKKWIRTGTCLACGKCCFMANLVSAPILQMKLRDNPDLLEFLQSDAGKQITCKHLVLDPKCEGRYLCSIFGKEERPQYCIDHPSSPLSVTEGCSGYSFYTEEGD